jgi:chromatin modification-related protein YNG2
MTRQVSKLNPATPPNPNGPQLPIPPGAPLPTAHLSTKETQALAKIHVEWEKIEILQDEKVKLADRMERIVSRARERARAEWVRVGGLDIEDLDSNWEGSVGGEIVLPPSGLGSGSDRQRSKSLVLLVFSLDHRRPAGLNAHQIHPNPLHHP